MTELEKRMWEDDIKFITKLREKKEELQQRIDKAIQYELELSYLTDNPVDEERIRILKGESNNE